MKTDRLTSLFPTVGKATRLEDFVGKRQSFVEQNILVEFMNI